MARRFGRPRRVAAGIMSIVAALGLASCTVPRVEPVPKPKQAAAVVPPAAAAAPTTAVAAGADGSAELTLALIDVLVRARATHPGLAGVAVTTEDGTVQVGDAGDWRAWSTIKVPIAVAATRAGVAEEGLIDAAITHSDNDAAARLWSLLGGGTMAAQKLERLAGSYDGDLDARAVAEQWSPTPIGWIPWRLADQAEFATHLPCVLEARPVYEAMGRIVPWHSDGLGRIEGVHFKGGWSAEEDPSRPYTYRQFGALDTGEGVIGLAVIAHPADGTHTSAAEMLDALAEGLQEVLEAGQVEPAETCRTV